MAGGRTNQGVTAHGYMVSIRVDKNVLELVLWLAQLYEYTKNTELSTLKG